MQPRPIRDVPGPKPVNNMIQVLGFMRQYERDTIGLFLDSFERYGEIHQFEVMGSKNVQLSHPEHIHQVLVSQANKFGKDNTYTDPNRGLARFMGTGLVTSNGDFWRRQRKLMQPAFHHQRIMGYADTMIRLTNRLIDEWTRQTAKGSLIIDVDRAMMRLTLEIVVEALFGAGMTIDAERIFHSVNALQEFSSTTNLFPTWFPTPLELRTRRALGELDEIMYRLIAERRAHPGERHDLLALLLEAETEDGERMTDRQIRDELVTIFFAGHETTANALNWTWYALHHHPDTAAALRAEVDAVLGRQTPTFEDVRRLTYTEQVIKETMRVYPPVFGISRVALEDVEIGGYLLPKGTRVAIINYVTQRDPRWWGEDAAEYRPERWTADYEKALPRCAYLPFGGGPRVCIGNMFAMMEAQLILAMLAQHFELSLSPGQRVEFDAKITLRPKGGLPMRVAQRVIEPRVLEPA